MIGALSLNAAVALINGVSLLFVTPLYLSTGGYELLGVLSFYVALTLATQFMDGGYALAATRALAKNCTYRSFVGLEKQFYKYLLVFLLVVSLLLQATKEQIELPINHTGILICIFIHQLVYFYSQCALGGERHGLYALVFLSYSIGRHFLLLYIFDVTGDIDFAVFGLIIFCLLILVVRKYLVEALHRKRPITDLDLSVESLYARGIMWGSIAAGLLAATDRLFAEFIFDSSRAGEYFSAFVIANTLSLIPLPVYRVFYTLMSKRRDVSRIYLRDDINNSAYIVTFATSLFGFLIFILADWILTSWLGRSSQVQQNLIQCLTVIFSGIAIGWMPATALQVYGFQYIQTLALAAAVFIGGSLLFFFYDDFGLMALTFVWAVHASLQAVCIPVLAFYKLKIKLSFSSLKSLYLSPIIFWASCYTLYFTDGEVNKSLRFFMLALFITLIFDFTREIVKKWISLDVLER